MKGSCHSRELLLPHCWFKLKYGELQSVLVSHVSCYRCDFIVHDIFLIISIICGARTCTADGIYVGELDSAGGGLWIISSWFSGGETEGKEREGMWIEGQDRRERVTVVVSGYRVTCLLPVVWVLLGAWIRLLMYHVWGYYSKKMNVWRTCQLSLAILLIFH